MVGADVRSGRACGGPEGPLRRIAAGTRTLLQFGAPVVFVAYAIAVWALDRELEGKERLVLGIVFFVAAGIGAYLCINGLAYPHGTGNHQRRLSRSVGISLAVGFALAFFAIRRPAFAVRGAAAGALGAVLVPGVLLLLFEWLLSLTGNGCIGD